MKYYTKPHRRYNPLTDEWILVSPHRAQRPWQGQNEIKPEKPNKNYDASCYLCPGNTRVSGKTNPNYQNTYVFDNDCPALLTEQETKIKQTNPLFQAEPVSGTARVLCFSPDHSLSLASMSIKAIQSVIQMWQTELVNLSKQYQWIQIFENKGETMGCSCPHPHGQVWASNHLPVEASKEARQQQRYYKQHNSPLLLDYAKNESELGDRTVYENTDFIVVVPFWATWPYETLLLPKFKCEQLTELTDTQQTTLADCLKKLLNKYDALFHVSFPYSMGWHNAPFNKHKQTHWQCHAHFYPPLLRSATIKKFMVGYEMLAESQRDITAEQAAKRLKEL